MTRRRPPLTLTLTTLEDRWTPAAAGTLDPTFGVGGVVTLTAPPSGAPFTPIASAAAADGHVVVAGFVGPFGSGQGGNYALALYRPDGQLETAFGTNGFASLSGGTTPQALAFDAAGLVLYANSPDGRSFAVRRLTVNGQPDLTFGVSGQGLIVGPAGPAGVRGVTAIATQSDGRILVVGGNAVGRLTATGQPDPSFGTNGGLAVSFPVTSFDAFSANAVAVLPDGRIVVAGQTKVGTTFDLHYAITQNVFDAAVVRLTPSGQPDPTFGVAGRSRISSTDNTFGAVTSGKPLADGRLLVAGTESFYQTGPLIVVGSFATLLTADGQLDPSYGNGGRVTRGAPNAVALADGRAAFAGGDAKGSATLERLTAGGVTDPTFVAVGVLGSNPQFATTPAAGLDSGIVLYGATTSRGVASPALFRVVGTTPVLPTPAGTVAVGGPATGQVTPLQVVAGGRFLPVSPLNVYPGFAGSVRTAMADVNGDGVLDYVTGAGPGGGPNVVVTDGKTGATIANLNAFETSFTGGVFVAAADLNGDGKAEVVVTPDQGGGPVVAIYDGAGLTAGKNEAAALTRFFGIDDPAFRGGARPALGDVNGDGRPDLIVAAGFGGGPRVALYDGSAVTDPSRRDIKFVDSSASDAKTPILVMSVIGQPPKLVGDFFVFEPTLRNGVFVAAGDLNGDGRAEVVVGGGPGGGPRVLALDGLAVLGGQQIPVVNFFAGDAASRGGVRVAVRPAADGSVQLVTGSGEGQPGRVNVYKAATARAGGPADQVVSPFGDAALTDGVFVG